MRKSISFLLCFSLLPLFSPLLNAQNSYKEINQAELIVKFNGTWEAVTDNSTWHLECVPFGGGNTFSSKLISTTGETIYELRGFLGLSQDGQTIVSHWINTNGQITSWYGRFVSESKLIRDGYIDNSGIPLVKQEIEFLSESFTLIQSHRDADLTWTEWDSNTFKRLK
jgi:hypothetical protein